MEDQGLIALVPNFSKSPLFLPMGTTNRGFCVSVGCRKADPEDLWDVAWVVGQRRLKGVDLDQVEEEAPTPW